MRAENIQGVGSKRAERFSPRYFRNLGAVMLAGWVGINGAVKMAEPEFYNQFTSVNPVAAAEKIRSYVSDSSCSSAPAMIDNLSARKHEQTKARYELPGIAQYTAELKDAKDIPNMLAVLDRFTQDEYGFPTNMSSESIEEITKPRRLIDFKPDRLSAEAQFIIESQQVRNDTDDFFRNGMLYVIKAFGTLPKPVIGLADINSLELLTRDQAATSNKLSNEVVLGDVAIHGRKLQLYPSAMTEDRTSRVLAHEIGHLLDETECGLVGFQRDAVYQSFNTFSLIYGNSKSYGRERNTISPYGAASPVEDKAELYSSLLTKEITYDNVRKAPGPIGNKIKLLLARLETRLPGITDYLLQPRER